ncbi:MAG: ABC transporter substrate-binding protein [Pseudolabrys sp.]
MPSPELGYEHATARVHHASWRRGSHTCSCAAYRTGAAERAAAAYWRSSAVSHGQSGKSGARHDVPSRIASITVGGNLQIEYRWDAGDPNSSQKAAAELAALSPDVILATGSPVVAALQLATRTVPIVFVNVADAVSAGFVASLAKPSGNITGFTNIEYSIGAKWLELLKEIAPGVTRVGVIRDPAATSSIGQFGAIQSVAPSFGVELSALGGRDASEIEHSVTEFARGSDCGLISVAIPLTVNNRNLIISLAARHRLPATYPFRFIAADGGLISYGPDNSIDPYRRAASYVDRILKGEKPADLPVQAPTKYELVINLKTAKALGLTVPQTLLARADEVIE